MRVVYKYVECIAHITWKHFDRNKNQFLFVFDVNSQLTVVIDSFGMWGNFHRIDFHNSRNNYY